MTVILVFAYFLVRSAGASLAVKLGHNGSVLLKDGQLPTQLARWARSKLLRDCENDSYKLVVAYFLVQRAGASMAVKLAHNG
ncbi:hypothetical protein CBR_g6303 [Chara braunii]|uniref:Secreted protein n=1 Tax=Chara braunii TaxID=69332 RepID=A0A388KJE3_CHABU|nr:hypothetical protein CBR_g6303 [Chara braunii]|eukprot:GBG70172.1 hypothetical protein CBR_g6303 [Chara braunii]